MIAKTDELAKQDKRRYDEFLEKYRADFPKEKGFGEAAQKAWDERYEEFCNRDVVKAAEKAAEKLQEQRDEFLKKHEKNSIGDDRSKCHGYVWLFLRK